MTNCINSSMNVYGKKLKFNIHEHYRDVPELKSHIGKENDKKTIKRSLQNSDDHSKVVIWFCLKQRCN